jgi:hypothetical protein
VSATTGRMEHREHVILHADSSVWSTSMCSKSAFGLCRRTERSWRVVIVLSALALLSVEVSAVEEFQKRNMVGRSPLHSFKLRWFRNERSVRKPAATPRGTRSPKVIKGSCLVRRHPDRRSVAAWFGLDRELDGSRSRRSTATIRLLG